MSDTVVQIEGVSKRYRLGLIGGATLRDEVSRGLARLRRKPDPLSMVGQDSAAVAGSVMWALRNVSLEVERGEVLGIIGRNGAGKSTLLKILSRVTGPTSGEIRLKGRLASLLEVGTGFHPELTGRDNIYLNGAILGMRRAEVASKFSEIVEFAEIERFIDTPVKRYSSGMYVRLAFAVAAHLAADILIVDEVLAVGDSKFQTKCLGKMSEVASSGRTVIFVSHNMAVVSRLCPRTILLRNGEVVRSGETRLVVSEYLNELTSMCGEARWDAAAAPGMGGALRYRSARLSGSDGAATAVVALHSPFFVEFEYEVLSDLSRAWIGFHLVNESGDVVFASGEASLDQDSRTKRLPGRYIARCTVPGDLLNDGLYGVKIVAYVPGDRFLVNEGPVLSFEAIAHSRPGGHGKFPGHVRPKLKWDVTRCLEPPSTAIGQVDDRVDPG
jgi:lipopolysaccharide transport system ATP-binding protein